MSTRTRFEKAAKGNYGNGLITASFSSIFSLNEETYFVYTFQYNQTDRKQVKV